METSFADLSIVLAVAFVAPLALGLVPKLRLPGVVLELILGIVIGPDVLGWVEVDETLRVLSVIGLGFLLFFAGTEVEFDKLRGRVLRLSFVAFVVSFAIAVVTGLIFDAAGVLDEPFLLAIILSATGLGVVVSVLKDAGRVSTTLGQIVIAGATVADFVTVILLSLLFSAEEAGTGSRIVLLGAFALVVLMIAGLLAAEARSSRFQAVLSRLQDTTAQIRVRGAMLLLGAFLFFAGRFGLEAILGAFVAGALVSYFDRDPEMRHPLFRVKLEAIGFGFVIPIFFVVSGVRFDLSALFASGSTIARVPLFLVAMLVVRGVPALLFRRELDGRSVAAAALLQATSLSFVVAATQIGVEIGMLSEANAAALVGAGLLNHLLFPIAALTILRRAGHDESNPGAVTSGPVGDTS